MINKKELPEKGELVLIKINKVMRFGAYCELVEYKMDAYLPIAEVASGWIKNIHEFIREGQKDVARVVFIDQVKHALDISLKKVTTKEKKDKINDYNLEKRAEKIFNNSIMAAKVEGKKAELLASISQKVTTYNDLINGVYEGKDILPKGLDPKFKQALVEQVQKAIKPKRYVVSYTVELHSNDTRNGIRSIKGVFGEIEKLSVNVLYIGAPHYELIAEDDSYPKAEGKIKEAEKILANHSKEFAYSIKNNKAQ